MEGIDINNSEKEMRAQRRPKPTPIYLNESASGDTTSSLSFLPGQDGGEGDFVTPLPSEASPNSTALSSIRSTPHNLWPNRFGNLRTPSKALTTKFAAKRHGLVGIPRSDGNRDKKYSAARHENIKLSKNNSSLEARNTLLQATNAQLDKNVTDARRQKREIETEMRKMEKDLDFYIEKAEDLAGENERLQDKLWKMDGELSRLKPRVERRRSSNIRVDDRVSESAEGKGEASERELALRAQVDQLQDQLGVAATEHRLCELKMTVRSKEVILLRGDLDQTRTQLHILRDQSQELENDLWEGDRVAKQDCHRQKATIHEKLEDNVAVHDVDEKQESSGHGSSHSTLADELGDELAAFDEDVDNSVTAIQDAAVPLYRDAATQTTDGLAIIDEEEEDSFVKAQRETLVQDSGRSRDAATESTDLQSMLMEDRGTQTVASTTVTSTGVQTETVANEGTDSINIASAAGSGTHTDNNATAASSGSQSARSARYTVVGTQTCPSAIPVDAGSQTDNDALMVSSGIQKRQPSVHVFIESQMSPTTAPVQNGSQRVDSTTTDNSEIQIDMQPLPLAIGPHPGPPATPVDVYVPTDESQSQFDSDGQTLSLGSRIDAAIRAVMEIGQGKTKPVVPRRRSSDSTGIRPVQTSQSPDRRRGTSPVAWTDDRGTQPSPSTDRSDSSDAESEENGGISSGPRRDGGSSHTPRIEDNRTWPLCTEGSRTRLREENGTPSVNGSRSDSVLSSISPKGTRHSPKYPPKYYLKTTAIEDTTENEEEKSVTLSAIEGKPAFTTPYNEGVVDDYGGKTSKSGDPNGFTSSPTTGHTLSTPGTTFTPDMIVSMIQGTPRWLTRRALFGRGSAIYPTAPNEFENPATPTLSEDSSVASDIDTPCPSPGKDVTKSTASDPETYGSTGGRRDSNAENLSDAGLFWKFRSQGIQTEDAEETNESTRMQTAHRNEPKEAKMRNGSTQTILDLKTPKKTAGIRRGPQTMLQKLGYSVTQPLINLSPIEEEDFLKALSISKRTSPRVGFEKKPSAAVSTIETPSNMIEPEGSTSKFGYKHGWIWSRLINAVWLLILTTLLLQVYQERQNMRDTNWLRRDLLSWRDERWKSDLMTKIDFEVQKMLSIDRRSLG